MIETLLIVIFSFLASRASLFDDNVTTVLQLPQYRLITILFLAVLFAYTGYRFIKLFHKNDMYQYDFLIIISTIVLIVSVALPYHLNGNDLFSQLHVWGSIYGVVISMFLCLLYLQNLFVKGLLDRQVISLMGILMTVIIAIIVTFNGINGLSEVFSLILVFYMMHINP